MCGLVPWRPFGRQLGSLGRGRVGTEGWWGKNSLEEGPLGKRLDSEKGQLTWQLLSLWKRRESQLRTQLMQLGARRA